MWIFGYGSLTWKADFEFHRRVVGYIKGYKRRFWQASIDHRGVQQQPGRVVTLVPGDLTDIVWGVAYEVSDELLSEGSSLNIREKSYQERRQETVYAADGASFSALVFIGTSDPSLRLGPAPPEDMARQIARAVGPSGPNSTYLFNLATFMRTEVPHYKDEHLVQLEELVKHLQDTVQIK
ncbi:putative glutathione-specific gamma-glutamylcyclotransferase 2 isoform X2 [Hyalella azteca]|uniref:glutathione-specific gamma-glutamylcyclotransferase n=1 Tax=Hyalella azteca TaxID=294128 RepID=A0A8B7NQW0_HYAAZ|nr:putative glutathione-specific gamma-glutamylcyclotransferase 2 isoform X2 [Hyalella azteca]